MLSRGGDRDNGGCDDDGEQQQQQRSRASTWLTCEGGGGCGEKMELASLLDGESCERLCGQVTHVLGEGAWAAVREEGQAAAEGVRCVERHFSDN